MYVLGFHLHVFGKERVEGGVYGLFQKKDGALQHTENNEMLCAVTQGS